MADEFRVEEEEEEEVVEEEEGGDDNEEEGFEAAQVRADTADLTKLYKLHQEIFIPYQEEVIQQLATRTPTAATGVVTTPYLRDTQTIDSAHKGYPHLTQYERTKCLSFRASQIGHGAKPYIKVPPGMTDSYQIAKLELESRRLPYILRRPQPNGTFEVWKLSDLVLLPN
jgi:DNA-directed RNA polymerase subunit K/omega